MTEAETMAYYEQRYQARIKAETARFGAPRRTFAVALNLPPLALQDPDPAAVRAPPLPPPAAGPRGPPAARRP
jgi:hypothetical protein